MSEKISRCCYIFECSVVFVFFFLIILPIVIDTDRLACLPSNHQGDIKGRLQSPKKIQNITIKCRMIRMHEVFQPEEQISNSAFCQFVIEFLSGTLHVSEA